MYSIVLFIVERSFNGFLGSGEIPTWAVERIAATSASGIRPVNVYEVRKVEPVALSDQILEAIARSNQREADISTVEAVYDGVSQLQDEIDAILRSHHTDVRGQMRPASPQAGSGADRRSLAESGPVRTTVTSLGSTPSRSEDDLPIGVVGGDHVVGGLTGAPLHEPQSPVDEAIAVREPRLVQLRTEIVVVEDERGSVDQPEQESDGPEEVGRIAALDDGEATPPACFQAEGESGEEGVDVLKDEGGPRAARGIGPVFVEFDLVESVRTTGRPAPLGRPRRPRTRAR